jgi:hypothetical protein
VLKFRPAGSAGVTVLVVIRSLHSSIRASSVSMARAEMYVCFHPPDMKKIVGAIALTPSEKVVVVLPPLFEALTVYVLAGQLSSRGTPSISHVCPLK